MRKFWKSTIVLSTVGILFLLLSWVIAYLAVGNEYVLPAPWETVGELGKLLTEKSFYLALLGTFFRATIAFLSACAFGCIFAVASYLSPSFEKILRGIVAVLRSLPTMAVLLLILVGGSYSVAPILIGSLTLFPLLYSAAYSALCGVDDSLLEMSAVYRVPKIEQLKKLYLPIALPKFCAQSVGIASFSLKLTVSAEVLAFTSRSLGGLMQEANISAEIAQMMALTLAVCLLGIAIDAIGNALGERI